MFFHPLFQLFTLTTLIIWPLQAAQAAYPPISKPGCQDICGDVSIPYPFGIGPDCYHSIPYAVTCNTSLSRPHLILNKFNLEVQQISLETLNTHTIVVKTPRQKTCSVQDVNINSIDLSGTPFVFSGDYNDLIVGGCGSSTLLFNRNNKVLGGCTTACDKSHTVTSNCTGRGCCSIDLPSSLDFYRVNIFNFGEGDSNCTNIVLLNKTLITNQVVDPSLSNFALVHTVLEWKLTNITMPADDTNKYCQGSSENYDCYCKYGTYGNPYLPYGCQGNHN